MCSPFFVGVKFWETEKGHPGKCETDPFSIFSPITNISVIEALEIPESEARKGFGCRYKKMLFSLFEK